MRNIGWLLPLLVLAGIAYLNIVEFKHGSIAFGRNENAFSRPRGWPCRAVAAANDEGGSLVEASVVQGDTRVNRDVFDGPYPHLAWNPFFLVLDLFVACTLLGIASLLALKINRSYARVQMQTERSGLKH